MREPSPKSDPLDQRIHFAYALLIGHIALIETKLGDLFEGVVHSIVQNEGVLVLSPARKLNAANFSHGKPLILPLSELRTLKVQSLDPFNEKYPDKERELEKWVGTDPSLDVPLDMENNQKWNQFDTNKEKFGIVAEFTEDLYTTPLDRTTPKYKKREKEAMKLAREIEQSVSSNLHVMEERNKPLKEQTEEEKYGSVQRKKKIDFVSAYNQAQQRPEMTIAKQAMLATKKQIDFYLKELKKDHVSIKEQVSKMPNFIAMHSPFEPNPYRPQDKKLKNFQKCIEELKEFSVSLKQRHQSAETKVYKEEKHKLNPNAPCFVPDLQILNQFQFPLKGTLELIRFFLAIESKVI